MHRDFLSFSLSRANNTVFPAKNDAEGAVLLDKRDVKKSSWPLAMSCSRPGAFCTLFKKLTIPLKVQSGPIQTQCESSSAGMLLTYSKNDPFRPLNWLSILVHGNGHTSEFVFMLPPKATERVSSRKTKH